MPNDEQKKTALFVLIAGLASALSVQRINELPGCWEHQVNSQWWFAVNGHDGPIKCSNSEEPVQPFHCYVTYNGRPAGVFNPYNGVIAAGEGANEDTFAEALESAIANAKADAPTEVG